MPQEKKEDPKEENQKITLTNNEDFIVRFRNYFPRDETLRQYMHQKVIIPPIAKEINEKLEKLTKDEPDLTSLNIAPKKANWDLKRDVEAKLEKLEQKTQRAIIEMMREKLQKKQGEKISTSQPNDDLNQGITLKLAKDVQDMEYEDE